MRVKDKNSACDFIKFLLALNVQFTFTRIIIPPSVVQTLKDIPATNII
jgi:hypothetical protein